MEFGKEIWLVLQIADSGFPTGGFAHSGGLEAAWQAGHVRTGPDLEHYLETQLTQLASASLPFLRASHVVPSRLGEIDATCDAFLSNHVARRASCAQGRAFALACKKAFATSEASEVLRRIRGREIAGHFAPVFGVLLAALQVEQSTAVHLFCFIALRGWMSAAIRLGIVGPLEAQGVQRRLGQNCACGLENLHHDEETAAQTAPMLDLLQGVQDRLYTRLFQS